MRVGLNSGPVIVGTVGDDLRMDYTAIGDTTNLASRMENMAAPGTVRVSEHTHRLTRDYFQFESLGKLPVKGKEEPQEAYELVRPSDVATRIEASVAKGLTRFVGRRKQIEALCEAFDKARSRAGPGRGHRGRGGVGKSRLLLELRETLQSRPEEATCLEGRCLHFGGAMPYLPILDIVKSYFDIKEEDREYLFKKKVREKLSRLDEKLSSSITSFHDLLSVEVEDEKYLQIDPQQRKKQIFEAIRDLLIRESHVRPLLLAVEDLHWIDKTSQEFLDYLIGWMANTRILLVLLYRPEYTHNWGNKSYYAQIGLAQMSTGTSAELVHAILEEGEVVAELRELILGRAGGNPLFVEELTHSLLENGSILQKDHQYVLAGKASEIRVPDTIQGIIAARLDRLEESLKRIMQVASVIGREFAYRLLATITGMREDLKGSLLNLQGLEFIYEKQLFPELEYIFKHVLTQEVAYNSLLLKRRRELHEKIGEAIEQVYADRLEEYYELLAYHYGQSDNKAKTLEYLDHANRKATKANALEDARGYFEKGMELLNDLPPSEDNRERRMSLLVNQINVFFGLGKHVEYHDLLVRYEPMVAELGNLGLRGEFYAVLGYCEFGSGLLHQAIENSMRAAELCEAAGNTEAAGYALYIAAFTHIWTADFERVLTLAEDALRITEENPQSRAYQRASMAASLAHSFLGHFDKAIELGQKALMLEADNPALWGWGGLAVSAAYTMKRDLDRAIEHTERAAGRAVNAMDRAMALHLLGLALCYAGRTDEGIELLAGLREVARAARSLMLEIPITLYLAEGYWLSGEHEKGRQTAEEGLKIADRCGTRYFVAYAHHLLGEMTLDTDLNQAATSLEKSIALFQEIKAENGLASSFRQLWPPP